MIRTGSLPLAALMVALVLGAPRRATGDDPARPIASARLQGVVAHEPASALPELLATLPRSTAAAIYFPHIDLALADLLATLDVLRAADPVLADRAIAGGLGQVSSLLAALSAAEARGRHWSSLPTPAELAVLGADVGSDAVIVPGLGEGPALLAFGLTDRVRFEAWLAKASGGEARRIEVGGEQASVVEPAGDLPLTCVSRRSRAYCQLGAAVGADPIAPLRALVALAPPSLAQARGVVRAFERLPEEARAYVVVQGEPAARLAGQRVIERARRAHRFEEPASRKHAERDAVELARKLRRAGELVDGAAFGLYAARDAIALVGELSIVERGARLLRELSAAPASPKVIAPWSRTPALARLLLRTRGEHLERIFGELGWALPERSLTGTFALLLLGVDPECPLARAEESAPAGMGWAFLLPSVAAIGVEGPARTAAVQSAVARHLTALGARTVGGGREVSPVEPRGEPTLSARDREPRGDPTLRVTPPALRGTDPDSARLREPRPLDGAFKGHAFGSTYELRVVDDLLLIGTGPGAGSAASRRLRALPAPLAAPAGGEPVLEGAIHLRAVDAALAGADLTQDVRRELRFLGAMRARVRPLLDHVEGIAVEVRVHEQNRSVRVDLALRR